MIDIPCVILSGGKSSRMGFDKSFLDFNKTALIDHQYQRLSDIFKNVFISAKSDKFNNRFRLICDNSDIYSPMVALNSILTQFNKVFIIPVDMPNVTKDSITNLVKKSKKYDITIFKTKDKTHNLCGIYKNIVLDKIVEFLNKDFHKIHSLLKYFKVYYVEIDNKEALNLNTICDITCI